MTHSHTGRGGGGGGGAGKGKKRRGAIDACTDQKRHKVRGEFKRPSWMLPLLSFPEKPNGKVKTYLHLHDLEGQNP